MVILLFYQSCMNVKSLVRNSSFLSKSCICLIVLCLWLCFSNFLYNKITIFPSEGSLFEITFLYIKTVFILHPILSLCVLVAVCFTLVVGIYKSKAFILLLSFGLFLYFSQWSTTLLVFRGF